MSGGALLVRGCYGRNCEGSTETFGAGPGEGQLLDENTWESSPIDGDWLRFPGQRVYIFNIPALGGRTPYLPSAFVSASSAPKAEGVDFTNGAGNIALFYDPRPGGITVKNGTCADYSLRLVLKLPKLPGAPPPPLDGGLVLPDAGTDTGTADGGDETNGDE